jgi:hypothetical protein
MPKCRKKVNKWKMGPLPNANCGFVDAPLGKGNNEVWEKMQIVVECTLGDIRQRPTTVTILSFVAEMPRVHNFSEGQIFPGCLLNFFPSSKYLPECILTFS